MEEKRDGSHLHFSIKDLFWCVTLIAVGLAIVVGGIRIVDRDTNWYVYVAGWFGCPMAFCAGICAIFQKKARGAVIGFYLAIGVFLLAMVALFFSGFRYGW